MIDVTFFGWLVLTLGSGVGVVLGLLAVGAAAYVALTVLAHLRALPGGRAPLAGLAFATAAVCALLVAVAGLRVGDSWAPALLVALGLSATAGASVASAWLGTARALSVLGEGRARRRALALEEARAGRERLSSARRARLAGDDLRAKVVLADEVVARVRAALEALRATASELEARAATPGEEDAFQPEGGARALQAAAAARDEVTRKLEVAERVLSVAEGAAFRVACSVPMQRLLRRRPGEATLGLVEGAAGPGGLAVRAGRAQEALEAFAGDIRSERAALGDLEARRPGGVPAGCAVDPLARAGRDLDALEAGYRGVLERVEVVRLRLATRAGMAEVASAAEAVSSQVRAAGLETGELAELAAELARTDSAVTFALPEDEGTEALAAALSHAADALDRGDDASLAELTAALRELG